LEEDKVEGYDSDTSDASNDFEIIDLTEDFEEKEENRSKSEDSNSLLGI
jgi:hypothetical protein